MSRRTTELLLLIAAAFPVTLLYALYVVNAGAVLSFQTLAVPLGLFAAFAAAHIGVRLFAPGADPALLPIVFALSGIGITFVTRLEPSASMGQIVYLFLGVALMVGTLAVVKNLEVVKRYKYVLGAAGIALLVLPMLIGTEIYGSKLWIKIGSFQFQPGEFAKVFIVLFLAGYLAENRELLSISNRTVLGVKLPRLRLLYPLFIVWGVCLLVVAFERDLGSALLFYTIFLIMLYVATGRVSYVLIGLVLLAVGAFGMYQIMGHVQVRVAIWLDPFKDAQNLGFQIVQALYSLADGGLLGVGIGKGLGGDTIPVVASDMIFAAIGEEMGLLGGAAVLLLFMLFAVRGLTTAARAKSDLAAFSAAGLTAAISFQAFTIVGGVTKLIPLTGVTLPFMSQGGSSLLASFVIVALLLRAGDEATGRSTEIANTSTELTPVGYRPGGSRGSHMRRPALDTPRPRAACWAASPWPTASRAPSSCSPRCSPCSLATSPTSRYIKAAEYQDMPSNNHTITKARYIKRGSIITADGLTLAESIQQEDGTYVRSYPNGNLAAHAVGYLLAAVRQLRRRVLAGCKTLTGSKDYLTGENALNSLAGITETGNSVQLTIDSRIQSAAEQALAGRKGAIVVLDPRTGAVLAWASAPAYDNTDIAAAMEAANASGGADTSMFDRATQALYSPGSTFKTVTLSSALENGRGGALVHVQQPRPRENRPWCRRGERQRAGPWHHHARPRVRGVLQHGLWPGRRAARRRSACRDRAGVRLSPEPGHRLLHRGIDHARPGRHVHLGARLGGRRPARRPGSYARPPDHRHAERRHRGGDRQQRHRDQPLRRRPDSAPDGTVVKTTRERSLGQAVSSGTAEQVKEAMLDVVQNGSGSAAGIAGVKVAGKTGTAETNSATPNSTFIGFAPYDTPTLAVSLVLEETTENEATAAAVAGQVLRAALAAQGM